MKQQQEEALLTAFRAITDREKRQDILDYVEYEASLEPRPRPKPQLAFSRPANRQPDQPRQ